MGSIKLSERIETLPRILVIVRDSVAYFHCQLNCSVCIVYFVDATASLCWNPLVPIKLYPTKTPITVWSYFSVVARGLFLKTYRVINPRRWTSLQTWCWINVLLTSKHFLLSRLFREGRQCRVQRNLLESSDIQVDNLGSAL